MYYQKYRPQTISEIDNSRVKDQLSKILSEPTIPHALLFVGDKGTGKTSSARILAKAINCQKPNNFEPCNTCQNCLSITQSTFTDVLEMDAASNRGIDEVKNLIKETAFLPMNGKYRVFIIDEAHMITPDGFNALLKTLEEPPKTVVFILATTNLEKIPTTIASRCLKVNFGKGKKQDIITMLNRIQKNEKLNYDPKIIKLIADYSEHSFRDASKILEEVVIQKILTIDQLEKYLGIRGRNDLISIIEQKNVKKTFSWIEEFNSSNGNFKNLIENLLNNLRLQLLLKKGVDINDDSIIPTKMDQKYILLLIKLLMEAYKNLKISPIDSLPLEIALSEFYNELQSLS